MPFQIVKSNQRLPRVDVLVLFRQAETAPARDARSRADSEDGGSADIRVVPSPGAGIPSKYIYSYGKPESWEEVSACYREVLEALPRHGWASVAVPLCPSTLSPQEVYRIACAEIRRTLAEQELQIVLIVDSVKTLQPAAGLIRIVKEYIGQYFTGSEPAHARTPKEKAARGRNFLYKARKNPTAAENWSEYAGFGEGEPLPQKPPAEAEPDEPTADEGPLVAPTLCEPELSLDSFCLDAADPFDSLFMPFSPSPPEEGTFTRFNPQAGTIRLDESFSQAVLRLIEEKGLTDPQCYSRANLSRAVFNKLKQSALNPEKAAYKPSKSTALALAIALELGLDEAMDLLQKAGFALSHSSKGDIIVEYFLANHLYDIFELNEVLFKFGEPLLGSL